MAVAAAVAPAVGCGAPGRALPAAAMPVAPAAAELPTADEALAAARAGAAYLARSVREDGQFVYRFDARAGAALPGYNMVRHAGAVYSMLEVVALDGGGDARGAGGGDARGAGGGGAGGGDAALRRAAERALGFLAARIEPWPAARGGGPGAAVVADGDRVKLGGVALAALALATHVAVTGDRRHLAEAQSLGRYLVASIGPDGAFVHQRDRESGAVRDFVSAYYPGEAILALVRLHDVDGDEAWLDAAERGARYLVQVRDRGVADDALPQDHWLLYAFSDLMRLRPAALYRDHALRIARAMVRAQRREPYDGAWDAEGRSTPAATRAEGLLAALPLAVTPAAVATPGSAGAGETPADAVAIGRAAGRAIGFVLRTQVGPARRGVARASGGFTSTVRSPEIRIDNVQHAISALLGYRRALGAGWIGGNKLERLRRSRSAPHPMCDRVAGARPRSWRRRPSATDQGGAGTAPP